MISICYIFDIVGYLTSCKIGVKMYVKEKCNDKVQFQYLTCTM